MQARVLYLSLFLLAGCAGQSVFEAPPEPAEQTSAAAAMATPAANEPTKAAPVIGPARKAESAMPTIDLANSVFFPPSGTTVDEAGRQRVLGHAARLKENPELLVTLVGHTDDLGSPSYNLAIAEQRISAVHAILRSQQIPVSRIRRQVVGSEQMPANCRSVECRRKMRRVDLVFSQ